MFAPNYRALPQPHALPAGAAVNARRDSRTGFDETACRGRVGVREITRGERSTAPGCVLVGGAQGVACPTRVCVLKRVAAGRIVGDTEASSHRLDTAEGCAGEAAGKWSSIIEWGWPGACRAFSGSFDLIQSRRLARSTWPGSPALTSGGIAIHPALALGS